MRLALCLAALAVGGCSDKSAPPSGIRQHTVGYVGQDDNKSPAQHEETKDDTKKIP